MNDKAQLSEPGIHEPESDRLGPIKGRLGRGYNVFQRFILVIILVTFPKNVKFRLETKKISISRILAQIWIRFRSVLGLVPAWP